MLQWKANRAGWGSDPIRGKIYGLNGKNALKSYIFTPVSLKCVRLNS